VEIVRAARGYQSYTNSSPDFYAHIYMNREYFAAKKRRTITTRTAKVCTRWTNHAPELWLQHSRSFAVTNAYA
jgi:hypothetical protein